MPAFTEKSVPVRSSIHKDRSKPKVGENKEKVLLKERANVRTYEKSPEGLQQMIADLDAKTGGKGLSVVIERAETQLGTDARNFIRSNFDKLYKGETGEYFMDLGLTEGMKDPAFVAEFQRLSLAGNDLNRIKAAIVKPIADKLQASSSSTGAWESLIEARGAAADGGDDEEEDVA